MHREMLVRQEREQRDFPTKTRYKLAWLENQRNKKDVTVLQEEGYSVQGAEYQGES